MRRKAQGKNMKAKAWNDGDNKKSDLKENSTQMVLYLTIRDDYKQVGYEN